MRLRRAWLLLLVLAGCLTHLPPPRQHLQMLVDWADDFPSAAKESRATGKPLLLVLVAGELDGPC